MGTDPLSQAQPWWVIFSLPSISWSLSFSFHPVCCGELLGDAPGSGAIPLCLILETTPHLPENLRLHFNVLIYLLGLVNLTCSGAITIAKPLNLPPMRTRSDSHPSRPFARYPVCGSANQQLPSSPASSENCGSASSHFSPICRLSSRLPPWSTTRCRQLSTHPRMRLTCAV